MCVQGQSVCGEPALLNVQCVSGDGLLAHFITDSLSGHFDLPNHKHLSITSQ